MITMPIHEKNEQIGSSLLNDFKLLLDAHKKDVSTRLPKFAPGFVERADKLAQETLISFVEKSEAISRSGHYSGRGELNERRLAARAAYLRLHAFRSDSVDVLRKQQDEMRAALLNRKNNPSEPFERVLQEMRHRELREHLRSLDPIEVQMRIKQVTDTGATELLDALEGAPVGFPIANPETVKAARQAIAERNHPELGEIAQLARAYDYLVNIGLQALVTISGFDLVALDTESNPISDAQRR